MICFSLFELPVAAEDRPCFNELLCKANCVVCHCFFLEDVTLVILKYLLLQRIDHMSILSVTVVDFIAQKHCRLPLSWQFDVMAAA